MLSQARRGKGEGVRKTKNVGHREKKVRASADDLNVRRLGMPFVEPVGKGEARMTIEREGEFWNRGGEIVPGVI